MFTDSGVVEMLAEVTAPTITTRVGSIYECHPSLSCTPHPHPPHTHVLDTLNLVAAQPLLKAARLIHGLCLEARSVMELFFIKSLLISSGSIYSIRKIATIMMSY